VYADGVTLFGSFITAGVGLAATADLSDGIMTASKQSANIV
jgi:hypothetical protein